ACEEGLIVSAVISHMTKLIDDDDEKTSTIMVESIRVSLGIKRTSTRPNSKAFGMVVEAVSVASDNTGASTSLVKKASSMQCYSPPRSTDDEDKAKNASSCLAVITSSPPPTSVDDGEAAGTPVSFGAMLSTMRGGNKGYCTTAVGGGEASDCNAPLEYATNLCPMKLMPP
ncbi:hypothetical protein GW17_00058640, partial [Ensete ventricosum]